MEAIRITEVFEKLSPHEQCEVLDFADFLLNRALGQARPEAAIEPVQAIQELLADIPAECNLAEELIAERRRMAENE